MCNNKSESHYNLPKKRTIFTHLIYTMPQTKNNFAFVLSLILALWFTLMGGVWVYWASLLIAWPAAVISFLLYRYGLKNDDRKTRYKWVKWILITGVIWSLSVLIYLLIFD